MVFSRRNLFESVFQVLFFLKYFSGDLQSKISVGLFSQNSDGLFSRILERDSGSQLLATYRTYLTGIYLGAQRSYGDSLCSGYL